MKKIVLIVILCCVLLCACGAGSGTTEPSETEPPETTLATEPPTDPPTEPATEATEPEPAGEKLDDQVAMINELFQNPDDYYNYALSSLYSSPMNADFDSFFSSRILGDQLELTDQEIELLSEHGQEEFLSYDWFRLDEDRLIQLLDDCFGIDSEQAKQIGKEYLLYLPETGGYYRCGGGSTYDFWTVHSVYLQDDGSYQVWYGRTPEEGYTLKRSRVAFLIPDSERDGQFSFLANLDANKFLSGQVSVEPMT